jgi:C-terminal domain 10 of the ABC-three component (ABC-3C) systems
MTIMLLDHFEFNFFSVLARNALLSKQGTAFQDFFVEVGHHRWAPDFEGRRPQGKLGDKKCDGYRPSDCNVFQCYAPREMKPAPLCIKIKEDYLGALSHAATTPIKNWTLVHNDPEELPTTAHELIVSLRSKPNAVPIQIMGFVPLLSTIMELPRERLLLLFPNGLTARDLRQINYRDIDELIDSIGVLEQEPIASAPEAPSASKIAHNGFSDSVAGILKAGFLVQPKFESYFADTSRATVGNRIAERFKLLYRANADAGMDSDQIFFSLAESVGGLASERSRRAAIIGLITYMFHSCEIFKDVPAGVPA